MDLSVKYSRARFYLFQFALVLSLSTEPCNSRIWWLIRGGKNKLVPLLLLLSSVVWCKLLWQWKNQAKDISEYETEVWHYNLMQGLSSRRGQANVFVIRLGCELKLLLFLFFLKGREIANNCLSYRLPCKTGTRVETFILMKFVIPLTLSVVGHLIYWLFTIVRFFNFKEKYLRSTDLHQVNRLHEFN